MYYAALARLPGFLETAISRLEWLLNPVIVVAVVVIALVTGTIGGAVMVWVFRAVVIALFLLFAVWIMRRYLRRMEQIQRERQEWAGLSATVKDDG